MKRLIILIVGFLTVSLCAFAQEQKEEASYGQLYFEPTVGLTCSTRCGFSTGLAFGYHWNCGVNLSVAGNLQRMYCSLLYKTTLDVDYEFLHFAHSYPYISAGAGLIADVPFNGNTMMQPVLNYKFGYNFVIIERICDIGINYGGECIFLMDRDYRGLYGTLLGHSVNVSVRLYITGHDR